MTQGNGEKSVKRRSRRQEWAHHPRATTNVGERAVRISRVSAALGFEPVRAHSANAVAFAKTYALEGGGGNRACRVRMEFSKGVAGLDHAMLRGFHVTVQAFLPAEPELIRTQAPQQIREDLLFLIEKLGPTGPPREAIVTIKCDSCGQATSEFFSLPGRQVRVCRECFTRVQGGAPPA